MADSTVLFFRKIEVFASALTSLSKTKLRPERRAISSNTCFNGASRNSMLIGCLYDLARPDSTIGGAVFSSTSRCSARAPA